MKGKIVYYNPYEDEEWMEDLTETFEVKDWDELVKLAVGLQLPMPTSLNGAHYPVVVTKAVLYVKDEPVFSVRFNGGIYDEKNETWIVEETKFPEEVTQDMRLHTWFDEYDFKYEIRNGYMLLDPRHQGDGHIAVKLGDEIHEVGCFYGYMAPAYNVYDDGRVEDCGWIGLDDNCIREWYKTHKKKARLAPKIFFFDAEMNPTEGNLTELVKKYHYQYDLTEMVKEIELPEETKIAIIMNDGEPILMLNEKKEIIMNAD